jgi:DNA-binding response OmpR family regulator
MRILVVEDDRLVAGSVVIGLSRAGFTVDHVSSAEMAASALRNERFDLALVDLGLPGMDGLEMIRLLRKRGDNLPVLVLSARDTLTARVSGLDAGADDYLVKPFQLSELVARARALIRRSKAIASSEIVHGPLRMDQSRHLVELDGREIDLTPREWTVLEALLLEAPNILSKKALTQKLGGWDQEMTQNAIEVLVSRLRSKLDHPDVTIRTVRGIGYRIDEAGA